VLEDGRQVLPHNEMITNLCSQLKEINSKIKNQDKNNGINTEERRALRKKWKELHNKLKKCMHPYVETILKEAIETKSCLCIDDAKTGARSGMYGQVISDILKTECEHRRIPFVVVPCAFTSKYCQVCNTIYTSSKCRSKDYSIFHCPNCGDTNCDVMAADNIRLFGQIIWEHGEQAFCDWFNKIPKSKLQPGEDIPW